MKTIRKNRKEDLKLLIDLGDNYHGEDVTFTFSAGRYGVEKYVCSYIGGEAVNLVVTGTAMLCLLDNHRLPLGTLSVEIDIRVPDTQMPDGDFRHVTRKAAAFSIGGEQCTVELTNGASDYFPEELVPEAVINLLPTVIKGDPGQDADIEGCNQAIAAMVSLTEEVETAEIKRAEAEQQRMDSEAERTSAENERKAAENERAKAETQRQTAETLRTGAENTRTEAEETRITKETERINAETARQTAENLRKSNETKRTESETARTEAEKARAAAETSRAQAETARANAAKQRKLQEIAAYNTSDNVDAFLLNGEKHWLTRDERAMAKLSTEARQRLGHYTTEQCLGGKFYTIPCDTLLTMLARLEDYALSCFNYAIRQQAEVNAITSLGEVENYDVTKGYPEMLNFTI